MRTSAEVEAEVEASRDDLDRNVEALKQKMTPGQLFDEFAQMAGGTGQQVAAKFVEQAKANPMPLAVMGVGLAWLMMSQNRSSGSTRYDDLGYEPRSFATTDSAGEGLTDGLKDKAHEMRDRASDLVSGMQDKLAGSRDAIVESGRSAGRKLGAGLDDARRGATEAGRKAQRTFLDTLEGEPLLIAGAGLLIGLAVGAALPSTEAEDRVLGETRDKLVEKGKAMAQDGLETASQAVQATYEAAKSELRDGDTSREPSDRLSDAVRAGVRAGQEQLP